MGQNLHLLSVYGKKLAISGTWDFNTSYDMCVLLCNHSRTAGVMISYNADDFKQKKKTSSQIFHQLCHISKSVTGGELITTTLRSIYQLYFAETQRFTKKW